MATHGKEQTKGLLHLKLPAKGECLNITTLAEIKSCSFRLSEYLSNSGRKEEQAWANYEMGARGKIVYTYVYWEENYFKQNITFLFHSSLAKCIFYFPFLSYWTKEEPKWTPTWDFISQLWNVSLPPLTPVRPKQFVLNSLSFLFF